MANIKRYKKTIPLQSSWLGIFNFERLSSIEEYMPLIEEFNGYNVNDQLLRINAFVLIAKPEFDSMNEVSKLSYKKILKEALTYSNKELFQAFEDSGMIFLTSVEEPHLFLVDLWNMFFPNEAI